MEYDVIFEDVTYFYPRSQTPAIKDINLKIRKGEIFLITGPAGAGKTTLCETTNGLIPHFFRGKLKGNVIVKGINTKESHIGELSRIVGLLFQDPSSQLVAATVFDEVAFGPENFGVPREEIIKRVEESLAAVRMLELKDRNSHRLSGGQQQAVVLAALMAVKPDIYVLDEPTSNLDPIGSIMFFDVMKDTVKKEGCTVIIVEHKLEYVMPIADRMIVLNKGEIVFEGEPKKVIDNVEELEKLGLRVPQAAIVADRLRKRGHQIEIPLTLDEAKQHFTNFLKQYNPKPVKFEFTEEKQSSGEEIIRAENLTFVYPGGVVALKNVSLSIYKGDFIALLGQNGSGKTTLVKHFNGLLKPTEGNVYVFGENTRNKSPADLAKRVGYVYQNPDYQIFCRKVYDEVAFAPKNLKVPKEKIDELVMNALKLVKMEYAIDENPFNLSKGERQRVAIASVLAMDPDVLIVDEPTTGQDFRTSNEIMKLLQQLNNQGKTIIIITHDMELAANYCRRTIVLKDGEVLLDGPTREVFSQVEILRSTYLSPPQVTLLARELKEFEIPPNILKVDEMVNFLEMKYGV